MIIFKIHNLDKEQSNTGSLNISAYYECNCHTGGNISRTFPCSNSCDILHASFPDGTLAQKKWHKFLKSLDILGNSAKFNLANDASDSFSSFVAYKYIPAYYFLSDNNIQVELQENFIIANATNKLKG